MFLIRGSKTKAKEQLMFKVKGLPRMKMEKEEVGGNDTAMSVK